MRIDKNILKSFSPCVDRYKNFLEHYADFCGTFEEFLDLDKISFDDKIWAISKVLNSNQLVSFSIMAAYSVLELYESKFPNDKRIRDLLEYIETIKDFSNLSEREKIKLNDLRNAAYTALNATNAACAAAHVAMRAADAAAYSAAYAAANAAAYAAAYAAANAAAYAAAYAAENATYAAYVADRANIPNWTKLEQQTFLIELIKIAYTI